MPIVSSMAISLMLPVRSSSGQRRPEARIDEAADHAVDDEDAGQEEPGPEARRVELGDRHAHDRAHHDQHDARRHEDAERAAGGDGARRHADVVAGLRHDRHGHDAHQHHRRADGAGRDAEDGGGDEHAHVERPGHRPHHELEALEQALHEPALLHQVAHEDEQRHGGQHLFFHEPDGLEDHDVEGPVAEPDPAEDQREEQQGERDGEADEDDAPSMSDQHDAAEQFGTHPISIISRLTHRRPVRMA